MTRAEKEDAALARQLEEGAALLDSLERENAHLRMIHQRHGCPYGHASPGAGCALGYPGCACMDDLLAMAAWSPEDEQKAAVRIGRLLFATRTQLDMARQKLSTARLALIDAADRLQTRHEPVMAAAMRTIANDLKDILNADVRTVI